MLSFSCSVSLSLGGIAGSSCLLKPDLKLKEPYVKCYHSMIAISTSCNPPCKTLEMPSTPSSCAWHSSWFLPFLYLIKHDAHGHQYLLIINAITPGWFGHLKVTPAGHHGGLFLLELQNILLPVTVMQWMSWNLASSKTTPPFICFYLLPLGFAISGIIFLRISLL